MKGVIDMMESTFSFPSSFRESCKLERFWVRRLHRTNKTMRIAIKTATMPPTRPPMRALEDLLGVGSVEFEGAVEADV